jgi:putative hydrolase of the HAD superfamily
MSGPYRAVFFDLGGTLFSYATAVRGTRSVIFEAAKRMGVEAEPRAIGRAYRDASRDAYGRYGTQAFYMHRDLFRETYRCFARGLGKDVSEDFLDWCHEAQRQGMLERMAPRDDCHDTLRALRERGVYTSIVSNIDDDYLNPLVEKWELDPLLDHYTSSEEARSCKPDSAFFELALKKAGVSAHEVLFVGDSPEHDIQGARRVGMTSVLIGEEGTVPPLQSGDVDVEPHHKIRALSEVLDLVGS